MRATLYMEKIKLYYEQLKQWQRDSLRHIQSTPSSDTHHCHCCENDYTGNYCPTCGQRAGEKRLTWNSVRKGIMDVWGGGSRALPYTLLQLLLRPGYLIADYIGGRRQVSFPPVKMLVIVALVVFLISDWVNPTTVNPTGEVHLAFTLLDRLLDMLDTHYDWAVLLLISFFIIPTHIIFRHSPRCTHHTLPEGFFIQVFNSTQIVIFILLFNLIGAVVDDEPVWFDYASFTILFLIIYRTYRQLFGYSHWGTAWRLVMVFVAGLMLLLFIIVSGFCVQLAFEHNWARLGRNLTHALIYATLGTLPILVSVWINHRAISKASHHQ